LIIGTKILFLEDDPLYLESIKDFLEDENFIVDTCTNGDDFLNKIYETVYDLYILDINVPKIDGLELMKILKDHHDTTMKLVLTSRQNTLAKSFNNGCDDYLNKTTDIEELLIRIKSLIKRGYNSHKESIKITHEINYNIFNKKLSTEKADIDLELRSSLILDYMIKKRGEFITGEELERCTYASNTKSKADVIRYHIWNLRNKFGKNLIESKKSFGYKLKSLGIE